MIFKFSDEKNKLLFIERGITFTNVIETIAEHGILLDIEHPNMVKYPNQRIFVVNINNYPYCVPYSKEGDSIFLKTIFPARKFKYLIEDIKDE